MNYALCLPEVWQRVPEVLNGKKEYYLVCQRCVILPIRVLRVSGFGLKVLNLSMPE